MTSIRIPFLTYKCFICGLGRNSHLKGKNTEDVKEENGVNNFYTRMEEEEDEEQNKDPIIRLKEGRVCGVCDTDLDENDMKYNRLKCNHSCCLHCWFEYLKGLVVEAKVKEIKCFTFNCPTVLDEKFILSIIKSDAKLVQKYRNFKQKAEIVKCQTKKFCPEPDRQSFIERKEGEGKYVQCELGHKYCYICLKPWHGNQPCDEQLDKDFQLWKEGKVIKQCPCCKLYTEKNKGCNHLTCAECKYMWLCLGEYTDDHYREGKCSGLQFYEGDSVPKDNVVRYNPHQNHNIPNQRPENRVRNAPKAIFRKITADTYGTDDFDSVICLEDCFEKVRDLRFYKEDQGCVVFIMVFVDFVILTVPHILIALYKSMTERDKACRGLTNIIVLLTAVLLWIPFQLIFICVIIIWSILLFWWPKQNPIYNVYTAAFEHSITILQ